MDELVDALTPDAPLLLGTTAVVVVATVVEEREREKGRGRELLRLSLTLLRTPKREVRSC
jgi:hypothetical protein